MTDKEIEKALEVCPKITSAEDHCGECPYFQKHKNCIGNIEKDALNYINRLKSKNAELISLCKKKAEELTLTEWIRIVNISGGEVKAIDSNILKEQIRKETAKEILQEILRAFKGVVYYDALLDGLQAIGYDDYGVEVDE